MHGPFNPTETKHFRNGDHLVSVHVEDSETRFAWQLEVNGRKSMPTSHYAGILVFEGYHIATSYWKGTFPTFIPFVIAPISEVKS